MANKYKGEIKGQLGDKERVFRLTFENIINIENTLNKPIMKVASELASQSFSLTSVVTILHEGLKGAGVNIQYKAVGDMVSQGALVKGAVLAGEILATIFTTPEEDESPLAKAENEQQNTQSKNT